MMSTLKKNLKKSIIVLLAFTISLGIIGANPHEKLYVNAQEHGEYYNKDVNEKSNYEEKEVAEDHLEEPQLNEVSKNNFEHFTNDGYEEDLTQREEAVKVFVKGDEEKRLYFMSPVHVDVDGEWQDIDTEQNFSRYLSNLKNEDVIIFSEKQFSEITPTQYGFIGRKKIDEQDIIPFEVSPEYKVRLSESKGHIEILNPDNSINHILMINLKGEEFDGTAMDVLLELHELEDNQYGVSLSSQNTFISGRSFDIDLKSEQYKKYNNGEVSLFGVRSGAAYMDNSYNPGGHQSIDNAVIGNGDYNGGYIFCTGQYFCESRNNFGIVSFYNQRNFKDVIGKRRTVSNAKLHLSFDTNLSALNGNGIKMQALMLDPSKNFDVSNATNITYNNYQSYLSQSANPVPFGDAVTTFQSKGSVVFDVTGIMQSWENSGNHHGILIKGESDGYGNFLETAQRVLNHVYSPEIHLRPYIEITTVKEEPVPDDYDINKTTLNLKPFTANNRNLNVLQFTALGFDGISKPGSSIKVNVKDRNGSVIFTDTTYAFDGYRAYPQYTKDLGYNLPEHTQTYYRLTSNYQEPRLLFNNGSNLKFNHLYKVSYQSSYGSTTTAEKNSDEFIIHKLTAYDRLPRLLAFYGITDKTLFMQDNNMSDDLLVEGNIVFIRNPKKNKEKVYIPAELSENDKRMIDNNLLGRNQHCVYGYEPINFNTGNFVYSNPDTGSIDYDKEVLFERYYNSLGKGKVGPFGRNWNLEIYKELYFLENGNIEFSDGTGRILTFEKDGSTYKTPFDSNYKIEKYEISRKTIKVDSGYYDQDDTPRQSNKTIILYGYKITDNATSEELLFNEVGNITSHKKSQYDMPITYEYDNHNLSAIVTPAKRKFSIKMNSLGLISEITDPNGKKLNYAYDDDLNLIEFSDQAGYKINYVYDDEYRMLSYTGRESGDTVIQNKYDQDGKIIEQIDALNQKSSFEYFDDRTTVTNFKGDITTVYKDGMGYTTRVVEELIDDCIKTYDSFGNLLSETLPTGETLSYTYNSKNQRVSETNKYNQTKTKDYDSKGNVISITDFNGEVTSFVYDAQNRLTESHYPNGTSEIKQYNDQNQVIFEKDMYGLEKTKTYTNGSLTQVSYNDGSSVSYTYDGLGNLKSETDGSNQTISYVYDERNQLVETISAHHSIKDTYNGDGEKVSRVDGNGNRTNYTYDAWSRLIEETTQSGSIKYTYDENGNVLTQTDRLSNVTSFEYDLQNRKTKEINALGQETRYEYDDKGNMVKTTNPLNQERVYEYNDKNQLIKEIFVDHVTEYEYDNDGNQVKIISPYGFTTEHKYNQNGQVIETIDEEGYITNFEYQGTRLIKKTSKGLTWEYEYDLKGNQVKEIDPLSRTNETSYMNNSQVKEKTVGSVLNIHSEYDGEGRVKRIVDAKGYAKSYEYDGNGNQTKEIDANGNVTEFKYDHNNQVVEVISPEGYKTVNEYDANGNLINTKNYDVLNNTVIEESYEYNELNQKVKTIDSIGRETVIEYDELSRQISVDNNGRLSTTEYDEYGQVIKEVNHLKETRYKYNEQGLLELTEDSLGYKESRVYNEKKQVIESENEHNQKESLEYNEYGHVEKSINYRGLETVYETNALEEVVKSINPFGVIETFEYDDAGFLVKSQKGDYKLETELDERGLIDVQKSSLLKDAHFEYDGNLNITKMTIGDYSETTIYDKENRVIEEIDSLGHHTKYKYNILNQVVETEFADGSKTQTVYDEAGRKIQSIDQLGFVTEYSYDSYDNLIETIDPLSNVTHYEYDDQDNQIKVIEPLHKKTVYEYDERNRKVKEISPNGNVIETSYTDFDAVESTTYPNQSKKINTYNEYHELISEGFEGRKPEKTYEYDDYGRVFKQTDMYGKVTLFTYDIYGNVLETKLESYTEANEYDEYQRLIKEVDARGLETLYTYDDYNQLESKEDSLGYKESYVYDALGQRTEVVTDLGSVITEYDELGRVSKEIAINGSETIHEYDEKGQEIKIVDPLGNTQETHYDELGRIVKKVNEIGVEEVYEYNELSQVVRYQKADNMIMDYKYDLENNIIHIGYKDNLSEVRDYDAMNQLTVIYNLDGTRDTFKYDEYGNVLEEVITNRKTQYEYDEYDQVIKKTSGKDTYTYTYNTWGLLLEAQKNDETTKLVYGEYLDLEQVKDEQNNTVLYKYDEKGRQTEIHYPNKKMVEYKYDEFDRLINVIDGQDITEYTYDESSNVISEKTNNLETLRDYDEVGALIKQTVSKDQDIIHTLEYTRNEFSNVITEKEVKDNQETLKEYTYDEYNQIIKESVTKGKDVITKDFSYDSWGNKTKEVKTENKKSKTTTYSHNVSKHQLVQVKDDDKTIKLNYDKFGNMIEKTYSNGLKETYTYDDFNQLINIEDNYGKVIDYHYDALQERVSRREEFPHDYVTIVPEREENTDKEYNIHEIINKAQTSVNNVIDDRYFCTVSDVESNTKVIEENYINDITKEHTQILQIDKVDKSQEVFTYGLTRLSSEVDDKKNHHIINAKLDVVGIVDDLDETWLSYDIDGSSQTLSIPRFGYSSELHDGSLQYLRARYYDTELGVFISQDTYRGENQNQLSQNRYIYTENNNVNEIDPSGNFGRHPYMDQWNVTPPSLNDWLNAGPIACDLDGNAIYANTSTEPPRYVYQEDVARYQEEVRQAREQAEFHKRNLSSELADLETELRMAGYSQDEIDRRKLELIKKYCDEFDLDVADVLAALDQKTLTEKYIQEQEIKQQEKEAAEHEFRWWDSEYIGIIFTGLAVVATALGLYALLNAVTMGTVNGLFGPQLVSFAANLFIMSGMILTIKQNLGYATNAVDVIVGIINIIGSIGVMVVMFLYDTGLAFQEWNNYVPPIPELDISSLSKDEREAYDGYSKNGWKGNYSGQKGNEHGNPRAGKIWDNTENQLPTDTTYKEFDVYPPSSSGRDGIRFVVGENGNVYFTRNHYASFHKLIK